MDTLILVASVIGGLIAAVILIKLFYYTVFFLAICIIDGIFLAIATPFYVLFHPMKLFTNPKGFFRGWLANAPISGQKILDEKWHKEEEARWNAMTPEERENALFICEKARKNREQMEQWYIEEQLHKKNKRDGLVD